LDAALELLANSSDDFRNTLPVVRLYAGIIGAQGQHERAVELARRYPADDTEGYLPYVLARSAMAVGDYRLAASLIESALRLDPENQQYRALADSLGKLDNR
jgi:tetratricopeptide (TPR) repeat protein